MDSILKDDDLDDCTNSPTILFLISRLHLETIKNIKIDNGVMFGTSKLCDVTFIWIRNELVSLQSMRYSMFI